MIFRLCLTCVLLITPAFAGQYSAEINRAIRFMNQRQESLSYDAVITSEFLIRTYEIRVDTGAARRRLLAKPPRVMRPLLRVIDRNLKLSHLEVRAVRGWPGIYAMALHCDLYPLPWDFFPRVRKAAEKYERDIPQAIPLLETIAWLDCNFDRRAFAIEKNNLVRKIPGILNRAEVGSSLWIESLLALYIADHANLVSASHLKQLVARQRPDGSWLQNDSVTAKALWVLLLAEEQQTTGQKKKRRVLPIPAEAPALTLRMDIRYSEKGFEAIMAQY